MKLATKLIAFLLAMVILFLCIDGYIRVGRAVAFFKQDTGRDSRTLGLAVRPLLEDAWRSQGERHALSLIEQANQGDQPVQVRWVWLDSTPGDPHYPRVAPNRIAESDSRDGVYAVSIDDADARYTYSYVFLDVPSDRSGALEVAETLGPLDDYVRGMIIEEIALGAAILLASAVVVSLLGITFVGRPLRSLIEKTRRVGAGDFTSPLEVRGRDEFAEVGHALNSMCDKLAEAQERVKAETESRIAAMKQLRHADRLATVGRLASGVAHELGTPLNVVQGRAGQIARSTEDTDISACADIIRNQVDRMTRIVRQLLSFARPRKPQKEETDLRDVVDEDIALLQPFARKKGVQLQWDRPTERLAVKMDKAMIQQVLTNLLDNAIHAVDEGGNVQLSLGPERARPPANLCETERSYVRLSVKDDGLGITEENKSHLFDPFFTTKDVGEGTGLGLFIAYGIAREHGGWIDVSSTPGKGSCFSVYLPTEDSA